MTYYIQQIANTSNNVDYWTYVLDSNGTVYSTTDIVVLESKMLELYQSFAKNKLQIISKHTVTDDLTIV